MLNLTDIIFIGSFKMIVFLHDSQVSVRSFRYLIVAYQFYGRFIKT